MARLLTARQVQETLNVDRTTIYRMLKDGHLAGIKVGSQWRFSPEEVEQLLSRDPNKHELNSPEQLGKLSWHCVQVIQDIFAEMADIGAVIADCEGNSLTRMSNSCDFCNLIQGSEKGRKACQDSVERTCKTDQPIPAIYHLPCRSPVCPGSNILLWRCDRISGLWSFFCRETRSGTSC